MPKVSIVLADVTTTVINKKKLYNWVNTTIVSEELILGEILIILCSDKYLLEINNKYLLHNYYTDIITFDYTEGNIISGELYISVDRVRENSLQYKSLFTNELHRVIIHGVLHLCGFKDKTKKDIKTMREKEEEKLKLLVL